MINDEDTETPQAHLPPVKISQLQPSSFVPAVIDKVVKVDSGISFSSGDLQTSDILYLQCEDIIAKGLDAGNNDDALTIGSSFEDKITLRELETRDRDTEKNDSGTCHEKKIIITCKHLFLIFFLSNWKYWAPLTNLLLKFRQQYRCQFIGS